MTDVDSKRDGGRSRSVIPQEEFYEGGLEREVERERINAAVNQPRAFVSRLFVRSPMFIAAAVLVVTSI